MPSFSPKTIYLKRRFVSRSRSLITVLASIFVALVCADFARATDLYASDVTSGLVLKIGPNGIATNFAFLANPKGLVFDQSGNLYAADVTTQSIYKYSPTGARSTFATGFSKPTGVAFDSAHNLYVTDIGTNLIVKITPAGAQSTFASGLNGPADLAFNHLGTLFETDRLGGQIIQFTPAGAASTFASGLSLPTGVAIDSANNLFVADQGTNLISKYAPDGSHQTFATIVDTDAPVRLTIDAADNIYLSVLLGVGGTNIYKYSPAGGNPVTVYNNANDSIGFIALGQPLQLTGISKAGLGPVVVQGLGAPSITYSLNATSDLTQPFTFISSATADSAGHLSFSDANAGSFTQRFYRISFP
jgi:hypothetical protein